MDGSFNETEGSSFKEISLPSKEAEILKSNMMILWDHEPKDRWGIYTEN